MASEKEIVETESQRWYVARNLQIAANDLDLLPAHVTGADGSVLSLSEPPAVDVSSIYAIKSYHASLSIPGLIKTKLPVQVEVTPFSEGVVQIGIRPTWKSLRYPLYAERYFEATWSVLDALSKSVVVERGAIEAEQAA